jgi:hypothetical protein
MTCLPWVAIDLGGPAAAQGQRGRPLNVIHRLSVAARRRQLPQGQSRRHPAHDIAEADFLIVDETWQPNSIP